MLYQLSYLAGLNPDFFPAVPTKNRPASAAGSGYSGGGIRTRDLRVMSPTSYQAAPPRDKDTECITLTRPRQPRQQVFAFTARVPGGDGVSINRSPIFSRP